MFLTGAGLLLMPNMVLQMFGLEPTGEVWIRVIGLLVLVFGSYYYAMAKNEVLSYYRVSVWGRYAVAAGLGALVLLKLGEMPLLVFAGADAALASWTFLALQKTDVQ